MELEEIRLTEAEVAAMALKMEGDHEPKNCRQPPEGAKYFTRYFT